MTGEIVYILCAVTSAICCVLLARAYRRNGVTLLLWSAVCFGCFALNNILLTIDLDVFFFKNLVDLSSVRALPAAVGAIILAVALSREEAR